MYDENPVPQSEGNKVLEKNQFKFFIGSKIIKARPMSHFAFLKLKGKEIPEHEDQNGYLVEYQDNYQSWSPANVFDNAYREISDSEKSLIINENEVDTIYVYRKK